MNDPVQAIIDTCRQDAAALAEAVARGDIDTVVRIKAGAETLRVHALHEHLPIDANLAAAELMRRAERALGLALRAGQANGTVNSVGAPKAGARYTTDFLPRGKTTVQVLALVDGITNQQFEDALAKARADGNLSRVQVIKLLRDTVPALPKPKKAHTRQPLPDFAAETGWLLRKAVERVERILADKRYPQNKAKVAVQLHGHLTYTVETLSKVLARINPIGE